MTDTGSNPFAEPDFSSIRPSGEGETDADYDDDDLGEGDDEDEEEGLDDELDELTDEPEDDGEEVAEAPAASVELEVDDLGNRVAGGTARLVLEHVARSDSRRSRRSVRGGGESRGGVRLSLHVAQGDMGRIIGRRGRTAQALRTLGTRGRSSRRPGGVGRHRRLIARWTRARVEPAGGSHCSKWAGSTGLTGFSVKSW